jgi:prevent-host-death family protein
MTMIVANIHEVKARLSEYLEIVARGERVLICKRNHPVAELRAVEQRRTAPRTVGGVEGIAVPASFFEPMPAEFLDAFESGGVYPEAAVLDSPRVAESRTTLADGGKRKRPR